MGAIGFASSGNSSEEREKNAKQKKMRKKTSSTSCSARSVDTISSDTSLEVGGGTLPKAVVVSPALRIGPKRADLSA